MKRPLVMIGLVPFLAAVLLAGCGTGEYDARFQVSLTSSGQRAQTSQALALLHAAPTAVTDAASQPTGVELRVPSALDANSKSLAAAEGRAQPPFLKIPGFSYAIERLLDDPATTQFAPVYCYLAAVPKADKPADALLTEVQQQVATAFPAAAWQDVQASGPNGNVAVKLLSVTGQQDFDNAQSGGAVVKLDGRFDLYYFDGPTHHILVGFRAPIAQANQYKFFDAARAAAGTLQAAAAAAPAPAPAPAPAS